MRHFRLGACVSAVLFFDWHAAYAQTRIFSTEPVLAPGFNKPRPGGGGGATEGQVLEPGPIRPPNGGGGGTGSRPDPRCDGLTEEQRRATPGCG